MKHGFYVWSERNYDGRGPGLVDRVKGWIFGAKRLSVDDVSDIIMRTHPALVAVKTRDGRAAMNEDGFADAAFLAADAAGAERCVWAYVYPWNPDAGRAADPIVYLRQQAERLAQDVARYRATRLVLNAEKHWFKADEYLVVAFLEAVRAALLARGLRCRVGFSSYALPSSFPRFAWGPWCRLTDEAWPQLYSGGAEGYARRAVRSARQHNEHGARRIVFGGPLYRGAGQMRTFLRGLSGIIGTITPPWVGAKPIEIEDMAVWWSMDQMTQDREAVLLEG